MKAIDEAAANNVGLRLESAEQGYTRLRALGFEAETSRKLIVGLGKERILSGATEQDINRVIVNLTQLSAGSARASQDIKEIIHAMPSLRSAFRDAFNSTDPKIIQKFFETNPDQAIEKFTSALERVKAPAGGLNDQLGKLTDSLTVAGREFGEPILDPLSESLKELKKYIEENKGTWADWGEYVANVIRGVNAVQAGGKGTEPPAPEDPNSFKNRFFRGFRNVFQVTGGAGGAIDFLAGVGQQIKEQSPNEDEAAKRFRALSERAAEINTKRETDQRKAAEQAERTEKNRLKNLEDFTKTEQRRFNLSPNLQDARFDLTALEKIKKDLPENLYEGFHDKLTDFIEKDLKKSEDKILDVGKKTDSVIDDLFGKLSKDNPLATVFFEGEKALNKLRENLKGLPPDLQAAAIAAQKTLNSNALFGAKLDNDFAALDLRQRADEFRNFKPKPILDADKFFSDFIEEGLKQILEKNGGAAGTIFNLTSDGKGGTFGFSQSKADPYTNYHSNIFADGKNPDGTDKLFTNGFSQSDARNDLLRDYSRTETSRQGILGGFFSRERNFTDLTDQEKSDFINKDNLSLQKNLSQAFNLAQNRNALNPEQQAQIDRKIISLSANAKPEQLTDYQRNLAATAAEKEAARRDTFLEKQTGYLEEMRNYFVKERDGFIEQLRGKAQTGGSQAMEITLKNNSDFEADARPGLQKSPTTRKTEEFYGGFNQLDFQGR